MRLLIAQPLHQAAFAPFGEVIEIAPGADRRSINFGTTERYHDLAHLDLIAQGGQPIVSLFRATPLPLPIEIKVMERHPLSSQAFVPLDGRPYLVAVAPPGALDISRLQVFLADAHQGVNYRAGVWHHYLLALERVSDFLVIDREGPHTNLDEIMLPPSDYVRIALPSKSGNGA